MSVVVFHSSVAPFVQQAARAIHEAGQLERFITSVADEPDRLYQRAFRWAGVLTRRDIAAQFGRRGVTEIPANKVESRPWRELTRLAIGALDRDGRATDLAWEKSECGFDRSVARTLSSCLTGVYGFEFGSCATFQRARTLGLRVAYDVPAPEPEYVHRLIDGEIDKYPDLRTAYHQHVRAREARRTERRREEWKLADLVIAASEFTKRSYAGAGLDVAKVRVVPYGAPPVETDALRVRPRAGADRLRLLWAGTFGIRKGAHYVVQAWREGGLGRHAQLDVFGTPALPAALLGSIPHGIKVHGPVTRSELFNRYREADALLFPTLCDGFGLVVTEAWSRGLPVIATERAGVADLMQPGKNGLIVRAGDPAAITSAVAWCLDHRDELLAMRDAALATARNWQWADYRHRLASLLQEGGFFSSSG